MEPNPVIFPPHAPVVPGSEIIPEGVLFPLWPMPTVRTGRKPALDPSLRRVQLNPISLRLFVNVVEEGTITAAAARANLTAAAVSKRVSELEQALGTALLRRTNQGVEPTAAGQELLHLARSVLEGLDGIYVQMHDYTERVCGRIRVCADLSALAQSLPGEIASFMAAHPSVRIHTEEKPGGLAVRAVADHAADVGVCLASAVDASLETFPYRRERLVLIAPDGHPLAGRRSISFLETLDYEYVGFTADNALHQQLVNAAARSYRSIKLSFQVSGYDVLCQMVHAGLGIGILPEAAAAQYVGSSRIAIVALDEAWGDRELKIYVLRYNMLPAAAKLLVDHLRR